MDVTDSLKGWMNQRMKSPYFANVVIVWLVIHWRLVFGIFNFQTTEPRADRIQWISDMMNSYCWGSFCGWFPTLMLSFFIALITTFLFSLVNGVGTASHRLGNALSTAIVRLAEKEKWKKVELYNKLEKDFKDASADIEMKKQKIHELNVQIGTERENVKIAEKMGEDAVKKVKIESDGWKKKMNDLNNEMSKLKAGTGLIHKHKLTPILFLADDWKVAQDIDTTNQTEENWKINEDGQITRDGARLFSITGIRVVDRILSFSKVRTQGPGNTTFQLIAINDDLLEGLELNQERYVVNRIRLERIPKIYEKEL